MTTISAIFAAVVLVAPVLAVPTDVFYDDFESPVSSEQPDNGAYPGDWTASPAGGCYTASAHDAGETPYEGSQVLRYNYVYGEGNFARGSFESALTTGEALHAEMAIWLKMPETTGTFNLRFLDSSDNILFNATNKQEGYIRNSADDQNYTTLTWLTDDWNFFEVDYVVGSTSLTYTLNSTSQTLATAAHSEISQIWLGSGGASPSDFLVDVLLVQADSGGGPVYNRGDVTEDDFVGADDLVRILTHWGESGSVPWENGDCAPYGDGSAPGDDFVGADDYVEVLTYWGTDYSSPEPTPEPATMLVLALGAGLALLRRR